MGIVIPSGGENIAPTNIEDEIKRELEEIVSNAMVVGDRKRYITCLLTLGVTVDPVTLAPTNILDSRATAWLKDQVGDISSYSTVEALLSSPVWSQVESSLQAGVDRANNKAVSNVAKVKKWKVLPREFSVDGGELGPTLKLKRFHVLEMYRDLIDRMYEEEY